MHIKMNKAAFGYLKGVKLGIACFAPVIPAIRGKDNEAKQQVDKQLSLGQKALLIFEAWKNSTFRLRTWFIRRSCSYPFGH
ncbi:hypothetical protein [Bacillus sp. PK3_68]|uniref:hypothetical protein n=1 Tax=Bacillus sp. PK3_68 TaxID=2027408 RepID=UPI000E743F37|nr:hypothetical protein [Bacillus sp. PK3_68]RJS61592.1 hypothetical protein CJ483_17370 [Bacillus sp. PK3_68]